MLCETCQNIFRGTFTTDRVRHHATWQDLRQSAIDECSICMVLWDMKPKIHAATSFTSTSAPKIGTHEATRRALGHYGPFEKGGMSLYFHFDNQTGPFVLFYLRVASGK
jgi:hypothetical protein